MIFIALFVFIAIVVIGLNLHDSSNLEKIKEHLNVNYCNDYIYSRGSYKAFFDDKVLEVQNSFLVNLQKNSKEIYYKDIKDLKIKKNSLLINENKEKLEFKLENEAKEFYEKLKRKIK